MTKQHESLRARSRSVQRIAQAERAIHRHRGTIRFYDKPPPAAHVGEAWTGLTRRGPACASGPRPRDPRADAARARRLPPRRAAPGAPDGEGAAKTAICHVFGRRYCREALAVSWCESRHSTTAHNGQYLGLFQMGSHERQQFGHGPTALKQARAAHKYFVLTDRDWSPWSCKPSYGV